MTEKSSWVRAPIWDRWRQLTKFMGSARIAFAASAENLAQRDPNLELSMRLGDGPSTYRTSVDEHVRIASDPSKLHGLVLLESYALMESHCRLVRWIVDHHRFDLLAGRVPEEVLARLDDVRLTGGIEAWSEDLLARTGQSFDIVRGGRAGLIEVSMVRNLLAHGRQSVVAADLADAMKRGARLPFEAGHPILISYVLLNEYRGRIRQFCRALGDGVVHQHRGTHRSPPKSKKRLG
jgi:hypothetical protein